MSRSFPFVLATVFLAGALSAQAHQAALPASLVSVSAYAGAAAAQGDDLAAKVKAALKADADLATASDALTITSAAGGLVTLEGTVPTVQLRAKIGEAVQKVEGVTKLNNKLKLGKK